MDNTIRCYRKLIDMAGGNSFGICIPKQIIKNLSIGPGEFVKVIQEKDRIVIQKVNDYPET